VWTVLDELREQVAAAARAMAAAGLVRGTAGNVSARSGDLVAVTPTGVTARDLEAAQIPVVDLAGARVAGDWAPTSELPMHLAVYASRPDSAAIVHTHSTFATTFAVLGEEIPAVHYVVGFAGRRVPVAAYGTYGSDEIGANCVAAIGDANAVLLANHGVIALGATPAKALAVAEAVEFTAEVCWRARAVGTPVVLDDAEMDRVIAAFASYGQPGDPGA
jgi:ribulose-5-phosphate 4-epimerase/fuculose-1-phosphate aldolase